MGVYIKGMEMPKDCGECFFYDEAHNWCEAKDKHLHNAKDETNKAIWCPLVEVPTPHGRLIAADKFERDIEQYHLSDGKFQHWVQVQPTIIEAEGGDENDE